VSMPRFCTVLPEGKVYRDIKPAEGQDLWKALVAKDEKAFAKRLIWDFSQSRAQNQKHKAGH